MKYQICHNNCMKYILFLTPMLLMRSLRSWISMGCWSPLWKSTCRKNYRREKETWSPGTYRHTRVCDITGVTQRVSYAIWSRVMEKIIQVRHDRCTSGNKGRHYQYEIQIKIILKVSKWNILDKNNHWNK